MIGNYLSTMLVCVFAYLYPLFLCFKVCDNKTSEHWKRFLDDDPILEKGRLLTT